MNRDRDGIVFGLMTKEEQKKIIKEEEAGKCIERFNLDGWRTAINPRWLAEVAYRIKPADKPEIMICPNKTHFDGRLHNRNSLCRSMGCIPCLLEKAAELPEELGELSSNKECKKTVNQIICHMKTYFPIGEMPKCCCACPVNCSCIFSFCPRKFMKKVKHVRLRAKEAGNDKK